MQRVVVERKKPTVSQLSNVEYHMLRCFLSASLTWFGIPGPQAKLLKVIRKRTPDISLPERIETPILSDREEKGQTTVSSEDQPCKAQDETPRINGI
mmetsp:Transcript_19339/g.37365  ORF Transcript_19339/g.37365 Transcript_19339/m.37365 type:complete len:97 (+) Transcript_19339:1095-1385(+)